MEVDMQHQGAISAATRSSRQGKRSWIALATMLVAALTGTIMIGNPANAAISHGAVHGVNEVTDDFGDEGVIDFNTRRFTRAVALWQLILWADGFYSGSIDCDFGPQTTEATKALQRTYQVSPVDGSAGPKTFSAVDGFLTISGENVTYQGFVRNVQFKRINGIYHISLNGAWRTASYTSASGC